jgi:trehalose 6-phosphate synthase
MAQFVAGVIERDDLIWVQDYHLLPLARELRALGITNRIGFFLHIPFPNLSDIMALPNAPGIHRLAWRNTTLWACRRSATSRA